MAVTEIIGNAAEVIDFALTGDSAANVMHNVAEQAKERIRSLIFLSINISSRI